MWRSAILTFLQAAVTFLVGLYLRDHPETKVIGDVFWAIGGLLVVHKVSNAVDTAGAIKDLKDVVLASVTRVAEPITRIGTYLDISNNTDLVSLTVLEREYISLVEEKLAPERQKIIDRAIVELRNLSASKRTPVLEESDFYSWLYREFDAAAPGSKIQIVSMDEELEWTNTHQEKEYFKKNVAAAKRGVAVERIFLFSDDRLADASGNAFIYAHRENSKEGLRGRRVDRESFAKSSKSAMADAGQGFIIFDGRFVIVDVFDESGEARGYVTFNQVDLKKYQETFQRFRNLSAPLVFAKAAS